LDRKKIPQQDLDALMADIKAGRGNPPDRRAQKAPQT
jgi:hypothetical protein